MIEAIIRFLVSLLVLYLVYLIVIWVLSLIGLVLPGEILQIILVLAVLLLLYKYFWPFIHV